MLSLCVYVCVYICVCICVECLWRPEESDSSGAAITYSWEPPDRDAMN